MQQGAPLRSGHDSLEVVPNGFVARAPTVEDVAAIAELSVDAESPTGATKLYERAGMQVAYGWEVSEKTLRR